MAPDDPPRPVSLLEVERKFRVHGLFRLSSVALSEGWSLGEPDPQTLDAMYFDTGDLRLSRARLSLRRREGGADEGWHLKVPVRDEAREELSVPLARGTLDHPPVELTDLVTAYVRGAPLELVAHLQTERTSYPVLDPTARTQAWLTDDSVSVFDGSRVVARFRELELELAASPEAPSETEGAEDALPADGGYGGADRIDVLDLVGAALVAAGAVPGGTISKVSRALGPMATAQPDLPEPPSAGPSDPARTAIQGFLLRYTRALVVNDIGVRRDLPDSVHQMRVAARRLRSGLKVFEPLLDPQVTDPLREELSWLAGELGALRDREVLQARLLRDLGLLAEDPHLVIDLEPTGDVVRQAFRIGLRDARDHALAALRSRRYVALLDDLVAACAPPPTTPAAEQACSHVLPALVAKAWRRLARDVRGLELDGPDHEWHETRIAAKRARYACESVEPVFGEPARRLAQQVELVTELLGEHQDAAVAAETVQQLAGRRINREAAFGLGLLCARQRAAVVAARRELTRTWPTISARRHREWLASGSAG